MIPAELIGTWALVSLSAKASDGEESFPLGDDPAGQLIYTASGHMAVVLMRRGRRKFAAGDLLRGTADEIKEAFEGFDAYAGTFEFDVDDGTILHHAEVCRFPNWESGTQFRFVELSGDRLIASTPPMIAAGKEWVLTGTWKRKDG